MHRNVHRTGPTLSLPKFFYQSKRLSSPMSHPADAGIHGQRVQYPSNVRFYQLNKENFAGVGQNGEEPSGSMLGLILKTSKSYQCAPSPFHRPMSLQRVFSTLPAHILSKQSTVSLRCLRDRHKSCCLLQRGQANHCYLHRKPSH